MTHELHREKKKLSAVQRAVSNNVKICITSQSICFMTSVQTNSMKLYDMHFSIRTMGRCACGKSVYLFAFLTKAVESVCSTRSAVKFPPIDEDDSVIVELFFFALRALSQAWGPAGLQRGHPRRSSGHPFHWLKVVAGPGSARLGSAVRPP